MILNNFYAKICPELLKKVNVFSSNQVVDCVVYSKNFKGLKQRLEKYNKDFFEYPFISAFGISLNQSQIFELAKVSVVKYISTESKVFAQVDRAKRVLKINGFYDKKFFGKDVCVAIIDTGIAPHLDFLLPKNRVVKFVDLINQKDEIYDDNGHGTFVAGVACGGGVCSGKKYSGFAPCANIVSIKALEKTGESGAYKVLEAMQWVYNNYKKYNIRVVCMSFGSSPTDINDPLVLGAEALWDVGIVVVAAAGNSGPERATIKSPGVSSKIITVGGMDDNRRQSEVIDEKSFMVAKFSSRGPAGNFYKPDTVAPAVEINGCNFAGGYTKMSGTSVATPMIAGACALMLCKNPKLMPNQVKSAILRSCKKIAGSSNDDGFGVADFFKIT